MSTWPTKDPNEVLDYTVTWELEDGETISSSNFTVASGDVVKDSQSHSGSVATVWLSGGTDGTVAQVLNRITTSASRTYDKTVKLRVRSK